ncbi:MAG: hypothetical protein AAGG48_29500 [Planctomycetota bacterium]
MLILAIDVGKGNSMCCSRTPVSGRHTALAAITTGARHRRALGSALVDEHNRLRFYNIYAELLCLSLWSLFFIAYQRWVT